MAQGRKMEPVALIRAKGKSHYSKEYLEQREARELKVDLTEIKAPNWLPADMHDEFMEYAMKLLHVGIMTELDEDCLARYVMAKAQYIQAIADKEKARKSKDIDREIKYANMQDKYFKQCHACASALGLTITSRCKLVAPEADNEPPQNRFAKFAK